MKLSVENLKSEASQFNDFASVVEACGGCGSNGNVPALERSTLSAADLLQGVMSVSAAYAPAKAL